MSDAVQIALIAASLPAFLGIIGNVTTIVMQRWASRKLDTIEKLSNSTLSHMTEKKEEVEQKLEQTKADEVTILRTQLAEANRTIALMTNPPKKEN